MKQKCKDINFKTLLKILENYKVAELKHIILWIKERTSLAVSEVLQVDKILSRLSLCFLKNGEGKGPLDIKQIYEYLREIEKKRKERSKRKKSESVNEKIAEPYIDLKREIIQLFSLTYEPEHRELLHNLDFNISSKIRKIRRKTENYIRLLIKISKKIKKVNSPELAKKVEVFNFVRKIPDKYLFDPEVRVKHLDLEKKFAIVEIRGRVLLREFCPVRLGLNSFGKQAFTPYGYKRAIMVKVVKEDKRYDLRVLKLKPSHAKAIASGLCASSLKIV